MNLTLIIISILFVAALSDAYYPETGHVSVISAEGKAPMVPGEIRALGSKKSGKVRKDSKVSKAPKATITKKAKKSSKAGKSAKSSKAPVL